MSISLKKKPAATVAGDRLTNLIASDRVQLAGENPLDRLQDDILNAIKRNLRCGHVNVRQGISRQLKVLEIDIDLVPRVRP
ncbi:MAG TPA: cell division topological specificity factor MinE [Acetobacteraceae bacterium]|nr:cell division topological specificity factor MinE [Acetobacteraceae bacterium]